MPTFAETIVEGRFVVRRNRFAAEVEVAGGPALAHLPNSGRMTELLVAGAAVLLRPAPEGSDRRTAYDLTTIEHAGRWVGLDSRTTPSAVVDAWRTGLIPRLAGYDAVRREVRFGESRLDLRFDGPNGTCYVEVKSVNLVVDGLALFPDAPTLRGARHLLELAGAVRQGHAAMAAFVVQRDDAFAVAPHTVADPLFARTLAAVAGQGVTAIGLSCRADAGGLTPLGLLSVRIPDA